jgi:hypothetical protein
MAFGKVNRPTLFTILHTKNIPDHLLSALVKIYKCNKIKIKLGYKMNRLVETNGGGH